MRHENLVNLIDVFRRKKRFFLVFEYVEHTVLEELEAHAGGLGFIVARKHIYQVLRALDFIHANNVSSHIGPKPMTSNSFFQVIHRDIKPENVLVSKLGVVKLCDFGFARHYDENETFTDYVATRWYRSPELLVGDTRYGKEVDIWAVGCLYAEMMTGEPLFPGDSDIDQLFQIVKVLGKPNMRHQLLISRNTMFKGMKQEQNSSLAQLFPDWNRDSLDFVTQCLRMDTSARPDTATLLKHELFTRDDFLEYFMPELRAKMNKEVQNNPLLKRMQNMENMGNNNGRKKSSGRQDERKLEKHSSGLRRTSDETKQSKSKDKITQIGLSLLPHSQPQVTLNNLYNHNQSTNIKETQNLLRSNFSYSNENLNLNTLTKKQILTNMNNTKNNFSYFNLGPSATVAEPTEKTPRILSAQKSQKNNLTKASLFTHNLLQESAFSATSPIKYQSLQSDDLSPNHTTSKLSLSNNQTSPNAINSNSFFNYFNNPRKSLVANPLSIDTKNTNNTKNSPIVENLTKLNTNNTNPTKSSLIRRERGLPMSLGGNSLTTSTALEVGKDADYRLLHPPPWLSNTHSKHSSNEKIGHLNNKRMTDWKTMHNELNRLSITDTESILLPTCPGGKNTQIFKSNKPL